MYILSGGSVLTLDVSENSSLWTEDSLTTFDEDNLPILPISVELEAMSEELASKGPIQTEIQLRYTE